MWGCNAGYSLGFGNWFWGHGFFGLIISLLLVIILISLAVFTLRLLTNKSRMQQDRSDSMRILQGKFAAGEISEEEFRRIREILNN
jgi:putative membrane protein